MSTTSLLVRRISKNLMRVRKETLEDMLSQASPDQGPDDQALGESRMDITLAILVLELTEFQDAVAFFGRSLRTSSEDDIRVTFGNGVAFISPIIAVVLATRCQEQYTFKLADRCVMLPGLDDAGTPDSTASATPPQSVCNIINKFLFSIGAQCLLDIKHYWEELPSREVVPVIREEPARLPQSTLDLVARTGLPPLDTSGQVPPETPLGNVIYSTKGASSSAHLASPSPRSGPPSASRLALANDLDSKTPINPNSPYGRRVVGDSVTYLDDAVAKEANRDEETQQNASEFNPDGSIFDYGHATETSSITALTAQSNDLSSAGKPSKKSKSGGGMLKGVASLGAHVYRTVASSVDGSRSSKGRASSRSRDHSESRSESAYSRLAPPPPIPPSGSPSQSPVLGLKMPSIMLRSRSPSASPILHITPDEKGFYDPVGLGAASASERVEDITRDNFTSENFWSNTFKHLGKCTMHFCDVQDAASMATKYPLLGIPVNCAGTTISYQPMGPTSGVFNFFLKCIDQDHFEADLICTKEPIPFPYTIDVGFVIQGLEQYAADRAMRMARDASRQLLLKAAAAEAGTAAATREAAEATLSPNEAQGAPGDLGK